VLLDEEYKVAAQGLKTNTSNDRLVIIDAGANIGLTTLYFFIFFPASKFILLEPDKDNLEVLKKNLSVNGILNAIVLQKALWVAEAKLIIDHSFRDGKEWSLTVKQCENKAIIHSEIQIEGISLQRICDDYDIIEVELFKMDIEGAERFLFNDISFMTALKTYVKRMVIEIHDEFKIRNTIMHEMEVADFLTIESGEVTYFEKQ
jgi:FkbM family methyltransferase